MLCVFYHKIMHFLVGTGEMAGLVKSSPHNHEDLSLIPQSAHKKPTESDMSFQFQFLRMGTRGILGPQPKWQGLGQ